MPESRSDDTLFGCLSFVARVHGRDVNRASVLSGLPLLNGKLTPSTFTRAAERLRLASKFVHKNIQDVNPALLPVICLLGGDKACVVTAIDHSTEVVEVVYPEAVESSVQISFTEFQQEASGQLIYCRPEYEFDKRASELVQSSKAHWFWGEIKENRRLYHHVLIAAFFINLFALAIPLFVMNVYDRVVPNQATDTLWVLAAGVFLAISADLVLRTMRTWFVDLAANRIDVKVSAKIVQHMLDLKMKDTPKGSGSLVSGVQGFESVRQFISSAVINFLVDLPFVIFFVAIIAIISPYFVVPIVVGATILLIYALSVQFKLKSMAENAMKASAMRTATLYEAASASSLIKAFNAQSKIQLLWEKSTIFISRNASRMRFLSSTLTGAGTWLQQTVSISIIVIGVYLAIDGQLSVGGIIAAYLLSSRAMGPIGQTAGLLGQYHHASTAMGSLNDLMARDVENGDGAKIQKPVVEGGIEFRNVSFAYDEEEPDVLQGLSFVIKPGERVAILGRNGSGKSSLTRLMLGLYFPDKGEVRVDGINVKQLNLSDVRRNIGYLPQESDLFFGTIQDNITYAADSFVPERLVEVANQVGLGALLDHYADGFNHMLEERGKNLSGGQRQLVALARALINDPPIMILDEPTGALDHNSEAVLRKTLKRNLQGKTLVVVTHKTSMLELVDRIIVIDGGRKVADGQKDEVLQALRLGKVGAAS